MAYVQCDRCGTSIHIRPTDPVAFEKRFGEGKEPIHCLSCYRKQQKEKERTIDE